MSSDENEELSDYVQVEPEGLPHDLFKGPEFSPYTKQKVTSGQSKKSTKLFHRSNVPEILSTRILCTACSKQINPFIKNALHKHPALEVIMCKNCFEYYNSGDFKKDLDGIDEHCRWCGEGGSVLLCDNCTNVFCRACIRRNLGRSKSNRILAADEDDSWNCFLCDPVPILEKKTECRDICNALASYEQLNKRNRHHSKTQFRSFHQSGHDRGDTEAANAKVTADVSILQNELRSSGIPIRNSKQSHPLHTWRKNCFSFLKNMNDDMLKLNLEFDTHFHHELKDENSEKRLIFQRYRKLQIFEELHSHLKTVGKSVSQFLFNVSKKKNLLKNESLNIDKDNSDEELSNTPKESDYDSNDPSETPIKRKQLKKRRDREILRKLSSECGSSSKVLKKHEDEIINYDESEDKTTVNQRISESESSNKLPGNKSKPEVLLSAVSASDIFDATTNGTMKNATKGRYFKSLPVDSTVISDSDANQAMSNVIPTQINGVVKEITSTFPGKMEFVEQTENLLDMDRDHDPLHSPAHDSNGDCDLKHDKIKGTKRKFDDVRGDLKNISSDDASGKNIESVESESDDQRLPNVEEDMLEEVIPTDSNSTIPDSTRDQINRIALMNIQNQRLAMDEEQDEDVEDLLKKEEASSRLVESSEIGGDKKPVEKSPVAPLSPPESDKESDEEVIQKSKYRNRLLNIRLSLSDNENAKKQHEEDKKRKIVKTDVDEEPAAKKMKKELKHGETLLDSNLSDEDALLLGNKDEDYMVDDDDDDNLLLSDKENVKGDDSLQEDEELQKIDSASKDTCTLKSDQIKKERTNSCDELDDLNAASNTGSNERKRERSKELMKSHSEHTSTNEGSDGTTSDEELLWLSSKRSKKLRNTPHHFNEEEEDEEEMSDDDIFVNHDVVSRAQKKFKRRRRLLSSGSGDEADSIKESLESSVDTISNKMGRRNIRKILEDEKVSLDTQLAEKKEMERRKRLEESLENEEVILIEDDLSSPVKKVFTSRLLLSKDPLVEVDQALVHVMKDHQIDGVKFLWRNVIENVSQANSDKGDGCILAHCMGLGKTLQVVAFLHTILNCEKLTKLESALVICPLGTVLNWVKEIEEWTRDCEKKIKVFQLTSTKSHLDRAKILSRWKLRGGLMVIGYSKYRLLSSSNNPRVISQHREMFLKALQDPGPDIVVCDEGHVIKNEKTDLSNVLSKIKTRRRIVLTGTPLQNNLQEYHCMVSFVKPRLLGSKSEFNNRFVNPILNGQHVDSTKQDVHVMKKRSHVLHELLLGCVQRKDVSCLTKHLQPKYEYVIFVRLSALQVRLYERYLETNKCSDVSNRKGRLFQDFNNLRMVVCHPRMLKLKEDDKDESEDIRKFVADDEEEDEEGSEDESIENKKNDLNFSSMSIRDLKKLIQENDGNFHGCSEKCDLVERAKEILSPKPSEDAKQDKIWFEGLLPKQEQLIKATEHSGKVTLLLEILRLSATVGDKVVVFSQSLLTLNLIEHCLHDITMEGSTGKRVKWYKDIDYFRLDGSVPTDKRKRYVDSFNNHHDARARLFLISTRAGGIGINLVGANRAVIFDASWNPTHDVQSIFRIYRFGQSKPCYVYRLIAQGTMEEKIYDRQVMKQSLAFRVVDEQQIERHFTANDISELYSYKPVPLKRKAEENEKPKQAPPKDHILAELLLQISTRDVIVSFHEHDSLLDHKVEEELSEAERKIAWDEYDRERNPVVKQQNPLLQLPKKTIAELSFLGERELQKNRALLEQCKVVPLSHTMLRLKLFKRNLSIDELVEIAMEVQTKMMMRKNQIEANIRFIQGKVEQLNFCLNNSSQPTNYDQPNVSTSFCGPNFSFSHAASNLRIPLNPRVSATFSGPNHPRFHSHVPPKPTNPTMRPPYPNRFRQNHPGPSQYRPQPRFQNHSSQYRYPPYVSRHHE